MHHLFSYFKCFSESYVDVSRCSIALPNEMRCHDHIMIMIVTNDQVGISNLNIRIIIPSFHNIDIIYELALKGLKAVFALHSMGILFKQTCVLHVGQFRFR